MKYGELTLGQVEALVNKLGGKGAVTRILSNEIVVYVPGKAWKTWITIKLGTDLQTLDDFRDKMKKEEMRFGHWAEAICEKLDFSAFAREVEFELVVASVAELGFTQGAFCEDVHNRARELGWSLCPPELALCLRLQYVRQQKYQVLMVAMEPIAVEGELFMFQIEGATSGLELGAYNGESDFFWHSETLFVFVRRKNALAPNGL